MTSLGVYLKRTSSRVTSASRALGVLNDYALYKSTHSLAVWQSLNSQPIDRPRSVAFSEEVQVYSYAAVHSVFTFCVAYNVAACGRSGG